MKLFFKRPLTRLWFKLKELTVGVNYVHGTRIPSEYPEYMWERIGDPTKTYKYLSTEEMLKDLKEAYADIEIK